MPPAKAEALAASSMAEQRIVFLFIQNTYFLNGCKGTFSIRKLFKELTLINQKLHSFFASEQFCLIYNKRFAHFGAICVIFSVACSMLLRLFCVCR
jgi:hypothetical protein